MGFTGLDGGIMVVLAAGLWLVYLMPTWFKRREYAALEKTNIRRQQALRVLEETAPVPVAERVAAIVSPNGQVADRDKLAEAIRRSRDAQAARVASRQYAEEVAAPAQSPAAKARVARRLRRTRAGASLLLIAAFVTIVVQVFLMVSTGIAAGAFTVLGFAAVSGIVSFAALGRLATIARRRASVEVAVPVRAQPVRARVVEEREAAYPPVATWTPVAVPKPLYLSRSEAAPVASIVDPVEVLRAAALASDRALRDAQEAPEVSPITKPAPPAPASPWAGMGIIDAVEVAGPDLDEALRRRRAG
jgi:hypothetical protein